MSYLVKQFAFLACIFAGGAFGFAVALLRGEDPLGTGSRYWKIGCVVGVVFGTVAWNAIDRWRAREEAERDYAIDVCVSRPGDGGARVKQFLTGSRALVATLVEWQEADITDVLLTWGRTPPRLIPVVTEQIRAAGGADFRIPGR